MILNHRGTQDGSSRRDRSADTLARKAVVGRRLGGGDPPVQRARRNFPTADDDGIPERMCVVVAGGLAPENPMPRPRQRQDARPRDADSNARSRRGASAPGAISSPRNLLKRRTNASGGAGRSSRFL